MIPLLKPKFIWGLIGAAFMSFALVSCEDLPVTLNLGVSPKEVTIPAEGGSASVRFTSPVAWKAEASATWVQFSPESGEAGDVTLNVSADANPDEAQRTATIKVTIVDTEYSETVKVIQPGKPAPEAPSLKLSVQTLSAPSDGASLAVSVDANYEWTAAAADSWVTLSADKGDAGQSRLTVTIAKNENTAARSSKVTFTCQTLKVELPVQQEAAPEPAHLTLGTQQAEVEAAGGNVTVQLSANYAWTAKASESWITVTPASGNGNASVTIAVGKNSVVEARDGKVVFESEGLKAEFAVKQKAADPILQASITSAQLPAEGGEFKFTVTSNLAWTATAGAAWVTLAPASGNAGTVQVTGTVAANEAYETRTVSVTIAAGSATPVVIAVTQAAAENPGTGVDGGINDWGDGGEVGFEQN